VELARAGDDEWLLSVATNNLGTLHLEKGDYERATALFEESLAIGEARGDLDRRARALVNLGFAALGLGDVARAHELLRLGLAAGQEVGLVESELNALLGIALCVARSGDHVTAAQLLGYEKAAAARLGVPDDDDRDVERATGTLRDTLGAERFEEARAEGARLSHDDAIRLANGG
jgi:tetratricopeptide (TPR) repeat protein